ncbi:MAG: hypothetical protein Ta2G_21010 [Termitinemataceae bacterium]|nr:MAG: hypothetical protein Ta2G_21010 [Termitinemataceae bacterium]
MHDQVPSSCARSAPKRVPRGCAHRYYIKTDMAIVYIMLVSTTKSPMQLYAGTYKKEGVKGFVRGAGMPCVAKKMEGDL